MDYSPQSTASSVPYDSTVTHTMSVADDVKTQHRQLFNPVTPDISPPPQMANGGFSVKSREAPVRIEQFHHETKLNISNKSIIILDLCTGQMIKHC